MAEKIKIKKKNIIVIVFVANSAMNFGQNINLYLIIQTITKLNTEKNITVNTIVITVLNIQKKRKGNGKFINPQREQLQMKIEINLK